MHAELQFAIVAELPRVGHVPITVQISQICTGCSSCWNSMAVRVLPNSKHLQHPTCSSTLRAARHHQPSRFPSYATSLYLYYQQPSRSQHLNLVNTAVPMHFLHHHGPVQLSVPRQKPFLHKLSHRTWAILPCRLLADPATPPAPLCPHCPATYSMLNRSSFSKNANHAPRHWCPARTTIPASPAVSRAL